MHPLRNSNNFSNDQLKEEWRKENEPLGRELGYPECCIKSFCDMPPHELINRKSNKEDYLRYKAGCIDGKFTGFIPCPMCAKHVLEGKKTLRSLIKNRDPKFPPFPNYALY